jgi:hypothetical protein
MTHHAAGGFMLPNYAASVTEVNRPKLCERTIMFSEFKSSGETEVRTYFKALPQHSFGAVSKTTRGSCRTDSASGDLSWVPVKQKPDALLLNKFCHFTILS